MPRDWCSHRHHLTVSPCFTISPCAEEIRARHPPEPSNFCISSSLVMKCKPFKIKNNNKKKSSVHGLRCLSLFGFVSGTALCVEPRPMAEATPGCRCGCGRSAVGVRHSAPSLSLPFPSALKPTLQQLRHSLPTRFWFLGWFFFFFFAFFCFFFFVFFLFCFVLFFSFGI